MNTRTFSLIKPNAVANSQSGEIISILEKAGFRILALKMLQLSAKDSEKFYSQHHQKPFFGNLNIFMTAGPIIVMVLEKENAVKDLRELIGATDPALAAAGTIRQLFGESKTRNAIHASDSNENAIREISFFFSELEIFQEPYHLSQPIEKIDA